MTLKPISHVDLVDALAEFLSRELVGAQPIGARLKFSYPEGGAILIDGSGEKNHVSIDDGEADCTVILPVRVHEDMLRFELNQAEAFRKGRMQVKGELGVALRLGPLLSVHFRRPGEPD